MSAKTKESMTILGIAALFAAGMLAASLRPVILQALVVAIGHGPRNHRCCGGGISSDDSGAAVTLLDDLLLMVPASDAELF